MGDSPSPSLKERILNWFRWRRRNRNRRSTWVQRRRMTRSHEVDKMDNEADQEKDGNEDPKNNKNNNNNARERNRVDVAIIPLPLLEGEQAGYFHLGGCAKELLLQGFKLGVWQIICTTTTNQGFELTTFGEAFPSVKDVFGGVEVFKGISIFNFSQSWYSTHEFVTQLEVRSNSAYGIIKSTIGTKDPFSFKCKLKCGFQLKPVKLEIVVPIYKEPYAMGYIVVEPLQSCLLGYRSVYNVWARAFDMHAFCLGFNNGRTEVALKLENFRNLRGSIFQRIGEHWALALKANLYSSENIKEVSVGGQYDFLNGRLLKIRIRDDSRFGFVYQSKVSENFDIMYHLGFDLVDPKDGPHRLGVYMHFHC